MHRIIVVFVVTTAAVLFGTVNSQDKLKLGADKEVSALVRDCDKCNSARDALMLIQGFRSKYRLAKPQLAAVDKLDAQWQVREDKQFVRLGKEWVTKEAWEAAGKESQLLIDNAFALIRINDFEGARDSLEQASAAHEGAILADYVLGLHFGLNNDPDEARRHFKKVLSHERVKVSGTESGIFIKTSLTH